MSVNSAARLLAACAVVSVCAFVARARQQLCPTASKFAPDDQIGNVNYITPA